MAKTTTDREPSGILIINKSAGMTSHDVVGRVRRLYGIKRVGHTGTLDPMATGVLVVLVGRAAKAAEYLVCDSKHYRAEMRLGLTTDTEDSTGTILTQSDTPLPSCDEVKEACKKFTGRIMQIPPMYSALKVGGKKLCDIARAGGEIERKPRPIDIFELNCAPLDAEGEYSLDVHCSSGTYIRTLCADIGASLGCGGIMTALCRTEAGGFSLDSAYELDELADKTPEELEVLLIDTEELFSTLPAVPLPSFFEKLCRSGCEIYLKKIGRSFAEGERIRLCDANGNFFALGEVGSYSDGLAVKAIKTFDIK